MIDIKVTIEEKEVVKTFTIKQYSFTAKFPDGYKLKQENYNTMEEVEKELSKRFSDKKYSITQKSLRK
jgi:hypothetical protein